MTLDFDRPTWMADALCRETPEVEFFPRRGGDARPARAVCARCLVQQECLTYALDNREDVGIWGGTSYRERRTLRRARSAPVRPHLERMQPDPDGELVSLSPRDPVETPPPDLGRVDTERPAGGVDAVEEAQEWLYSEPWAGYAVSV